MKAFLLSLFLAGATLWSASAQEADPLQLERDAQTGTAITILFDNSGSMREENKIAQAKSAFTTWLRTVPKEYKYSLITFTNGGRLVVPLGENTRDKIAAQVAKLQPDANTPICAALSIARQQIEKRRREVTPYERNVVLIFTDGQETVDARGADGVRADILALRQASVEVVGIGFHGEGDYMNGVATRFALAGDEADLQRGLAKVDAEFGGADDVLVTPQDLTALKSFQTPAVVATADLPPVEAPAATGTHVSSSSSSFSIILVLIVGFFFWKIVLAATKPRRR